jgi:hypothetical protein
MTTTEITSLETCVVVISYVKTLAPHYCRFKSLQELFLSYEIATQLAYRRLVVLLRYLAADD